MKPMAFRINWRHGYANPPDLEVLVDRLPEPEELRYEHRKIGGAYLIWSQDSESCLVHYLLMHSHKYVGDEGYKFRGYGGATFRRTLTDGTPLESNDCWSTRAEELPFPCQSVTVMECPRREDFDETIAHDLAAAMIHAESTSRILGMPTWIWELVVRSCGAYVFEGEISLSPTRKAKPDFTPATEH